MIKRDALFTSNTDEWETPQDFFDELDREFHFTLDVCALPENAKCPRYFTPSDDGLRQPWTGRVWCNPPYGKTIGQWCRKASEETRKGAELIVMLVHARTDTRWFHEYIYQKPGVEIRFVKGRLKFGGAPYNAPFPSMVVIFRGGDEENHDKS